MVQERTAGSMVPEVGFKAGCMDMGTSGYGELPRQREVVACLPCLTLCIV